MKRSRTLRRRRTSPRTQRQFLFNPTNPKTSFDVYVDKGPSDTIPIRYATLDDVKQTIRRLESLYKAHTYPHKRIWQVGMIMKVRLEVIRHTKPHQYRLAKRYFKFLQARTDLPDQERYKSVFTYQS